MRLLLTLDDIESALASLPGWKREGMELVKTYRFSSYLDGIHFVSHLGELAEEMDHHPEMLVGWRKVTLRTTTHSEGGLTQKDVTLAQAAEDCSQTQAQERSEGSASQEGLSVPVGGV